MAQLSCPFSLDNNFGPSVNSCRRAFDFTLLFEQSILSILPSSLFILLAVCQAIYTRKNPKVVNGSVFLSVKLVRTIQTWSLTKPFADALTD
jgi:ATP-binding cassette, subfamily C (CFTR/MRP), member 1